MNQRTKQKIDRLRETLIDQYGSQTALANALGLSKQVLNYHRNRAEKISADVLIEMSALLNKAREKQEKINALSKQTLPKNFEDAQACLTHLPCLTRAVLAMHFEAEYGHRQGERRDLKQPRLPKKSMPLFFALPELNHLEHAIYGELRANFEKTWREVEGRTDEVVSKLFNLGGQGTYRRLKKIVRFGCPLLIDAVNQEHINIHCAEQLCQFSEELVMDLLRQGKPAIKRYLKAWRCEQEKK